MYDISKNLKKLRQQRNWTQQQMADVLFVTRQAVSNWETGKNMPDLATLQIIAEKLDVSTDEILYGKNQTYEKVEKDTNKIKKLLLFIGAVYISSVLMVLLTIIYDLNPDVILTGLTHYMLIVRPVLAFAVGIFIYQNLKYNGRNKKSFPEKHKKSVHILTNIILLVQIVMALAITADTVWFYFNGRNFLPDAVMDWCAFMMSGLGIYAFILFVAVGILHEATV